MVSKSGTVNKRSDVKQYKETRTGAILKKGGKNLINIAVVYPNTYFVGMSNLGFQAVYSLLNNIEGVSCDRFFLPVPNKTSKKNVFSIENKTPLSDFDIVAFSISFENDYPNILDILVSAGIPTRSQKREESHPLVIAGGVATFLNPEPIADYFDLFLIGEAETLQLIRPLLETPRPGHSLETLPSSIESCAGKH